MKSGHDSSGSIWVEMTRSSSFLLKISLPHHGTTNSNAKSLSQEVMIRGFALRQPRRRPMGLITEEMAGEFPTPYGSE
jgi:hypothetical protein